MRRINLEKCPQVELPLNGVKLSDSNPKLHPERQLAMLEASFRRFRHMSPILVAKDGEVIAGHARVTVARRLGLSSVPAIVLPHLNDAERRAYRIADNAIAEKGQWSVELLTSELELLTSVELGFDPIEIGFETGEVDKLILGSRTEPPPTPEAAEPDRSSPPIARLGDIFHIGPHVVGCGDSKAPATFAAVLSGRMAQAVISDQPWNLAARFISGKGRVRHPDFVECAGELSPAAFEAFTDTVLANQAAHCAPGALMFQFIDWRSVDLMIAAGKKRAGELVNICVWVKQSGRMGSPWRSQHELVCVFRAPGGKSRDNVKLGVYGRNRTNVWCYDAPSAFGSQRDKLEMHPTCKSETMIADAILDCTNRGDLVLDAFLGSGTTVLAAHMAGRVGVGIELDPYYVDLALSRIADAVGEEPTHQSGKTFEALAEERSSAAER
jgi:DNA modification methylase